MQAFALVNLNYFLIFCAWIIMIVFWTIFLSVSDRTEYICGCEKSIIKSAFVAACIAVAGYAAYHSQNEVKLSELAMENVEALAFKENTGTGTLYGNSGGTRFCCCPGSSRTCGAAPCSGC